MTEGLITVLGRLAPREQLLVGSLVLGVIPLALVLGLLLPLREARLAAETRLAEAVALQAWVAARAQELETLPAGDPAGGAAGPPVGADGVEQGLIAAGLRDDLSRLNLEEGGRLALRFDRVAFRDVMGWMSAQEAGWGYRIDTLRLSPTDDPGRVSVDLVIAPPG